MFKQKLTFKNKQKIFTGVKSTTTSPDGHYLKKKIELELIENTDNEMLQARIEPKFPT